MFDVAAETTTVSPSRYNLNRLPNLSPRTAAHRPQGLPDYPSGKSQIFIVDDEELNVRIARKYLRATVDCQISSTTEPREAIQRIKEEQPDLILLDLMMPEISGLEILQSLRADETTRHLPIIVLTAYVDDSMRHRAIELGANDFLGKPIDPLELLPRVRNLLSLREHQKWLESVSEHLEVEIQRRTAALVKAEQRVVDCLARAAEYRDNDTGRHVLRVGHYAAMIAAALNLDSDYCELIKEAAKLHDVGKIGIPDAILLKTGKLDPQEYRLMQEHCGMGLKMLKQITEDDFKYFQDHVRMGASILDSDDSPLLAMASRIAMTHHEKWDGSGYPRGLSGTEIPLEGRITAVADVFDALSSRRPYKPPFSPERCYEILTEGRATHFDPAVVDAFMQQRANAESIRRQFSDPE